MTGLRVLSYNIHSLRDDTRALASVVRAVAPDVAIIQEAPRRFRWRQKCADLARSFDMVVGGGGLPALGNLILTSLRVRARDTWSVQFPLTPGRHMRGAAFVRCVVGRTPFLAAGSHLSTDANERPGQATLLKKYLDEADEPVVFGGDLNENSGGAAWRTLADGLVRRVPRATTCRSSSISPSTERMPEAARLPRRRGAGQTAPARKRILPRASRCSGETTR